jgi:hypothetical protein
VPAAAPTPSRDHLGALLIFIVIAMFLIVLLAVLVVVYVAYPHRGEDVPNAPWVGEAMRKGVSLLPTLDNRSDHRPSDWPSDGPSDGPGDQADDPGTRERQRH